VLEHRPRPRTNPYLGGTHPRTTACPKHTPSWWTRTHAGDAHSGVTTHLETRWSAPGRGVEVDLVAIGADGEVDPVVRVLFDGHSRAELVTLPEARQLAQVLTTLAARADAG
jgi:hypothetical protein